MAQILWYNSHIKCRQNIFTHDWLGGLGIVKIRDLVNDERTAFLTQEEICAKYDYPINFMQYLR